MKKKSPRQQTGLTGASGAYACKDGCPHQSSHGVFSRSDARELNRGSGTSGCVAATGAIRCQEQCHRLVSLVGPSNQGEPFLWHYFKVREARRKLDEYVLTQLL